MTSGRLPPPSGAQGERLRPENPGDAASGRRPASPRRPAASRGLRLRPPPRPAPPGHSRALLQAVTALAVTPKSCAGDSAFTRKKGEDFTLDAGWAMRGHVYGAESPCSLPSSQHDVGLARSRRERTVRTPPRTGLSEGDRPARLRHSPTTSGGPLLRITARGARARVSGGPPTSPLGVRHTHERRREPGKRKEGEFPETVAPTFPPSHSGPRETSKGAKRVPKSISGQTKRMEGAMRFGFSELISGNSGK